MNKPSCLSLVSNATLYEDPAKIGEAVDRLRAQANTLDNEELSHASLLPFRHVMPNRTHFAESGDSGRSRREHTLLGSPTTPKPSIFVQMPRSPRKESWLPAPPYYGQMTLGSMVAVKPPLIVVPGMKVMVLPALMAMEVPSTSRLGPRVMDVPASKT